MNPANTAHQTDVLCMFRLYAQIFLGQCLCINFINETDQYFFRKTIFDSHLKIQNFSCNQQKPHDKKKEYFKNLAFVSRHPQTCTIVKS